MYSIVLGNFMFVRLLQPENVDDAMLRTPIGISILSRLVWSLNTNKANPTVSFLKITFVEE